MFKIIFETKYNNCDVSKRIVFALKSFSKTIEFIELPILNNGRYSNKTSKVFLCGIDVYHAARRYDYSRTIDNALWIPGAIKI